jgi:peptidoglycan hydrolase-like protein with peptidoglycan-binding domain
MEIKQLCDYSWRDIETFSKLALADKDAKPFENNEKAASDDVRTLQANLARLGLPITRFNHVTVYKPEPDAKSSEFDGLYGRNSESVVTLFQQNYKRPDGTDKALHIYVIAEDEQGKVGTNTLLALDEALMNDWTYSILKYDDNEWRYNDRLREIASGGSKQPIKIEDAYYNPKSSQKDSPQFIKDPAVEIVQKYLLQLKLFEKEDLLEREKGMADHNFKRAIELFQRYYKSDDFKQLPIDGFIGKDTLLALDEALVNKWEWTTACKVHNDYIKLFSVMRHINRYSLRVKTANKTDKEIESGAFKDEKGKYNGRLDDFLNKRDDYIKSAIDFSKEWTTIEKSQRRGFIGLCATYVKIGLYAVGLTKTYLEAYDENGKLSESAKYAGEKGVGDKRTNQFEENGFVDILDDLFGAEENRKTEIDNTDIPIGSVIIYEDSKIVHGHIEIWSGSSFMSDYITPNAATNDHLTMKFEGKSRTIKHIWYKNLTPKEKQQ